MRNHLHYIVDETACPEFLYCHRIPATIIGIFQPSLSVDIKEIHNSLPYRESFRRDEELVAEDIFLLMMELRSGTIVAVQPQPATTAPALSQEGLAMFHQGVGFLLARWTALQLAVHNEWGGPTSQLKAQQLHNDVVAWMVQSKVPRYIDELEDMLDENLIVLFNTETEDGSLEEVAEQVMSIYEECLDGNFETIRDLASKSSAASHSASRSQQVENAEEAENPIPLSGIRYTDDMDMDDIQPESGSHTPINDGERPGSSTLEEAADGWQLVSSKTKRKPRRT